MKDKHVFLFHRYLFLCSDVLLIAQVVVSVGPEYDSYHGSL